MKRNTVSATCAEIMMDGFQVILSRRSERREEGALGNSELDQVIMLEACHASSRAKSLFIVLRAFLLDRGSCLNLNSLQFSTVGSVGTY
jgi:hypothetical protein